MQTPIIFNSCNYGFVKFKGNISSVEKIETDDNGKEISLYKMFFVIEQSSTLSLHLYENNRNTDIQVIKCTKSLVEIFLKCLPMVIAVYEDEGEDE